MKGINARANRMDGGVWCCELLCPQHSQATADPQENVSCTRIVQTKNRGPQKAWHLPKVTPTVPGVWGRGDTNPGLSSSFILQPSVLFCFKTISQAPRLPLGMLR